MVLRPHRAGAPGHRLTHIWVRCVWSRT